jgi:translation elongation factor EF-G
VISNIGLPLRILITDRSERFQLRLTQQGAALLAGFSSVQIQSSARDLILSSVSERNLSAAVAMLQAAIPALAVGAVEVVYLNRGAAEPWVRVRVTTPEDHFGDVIAQLNERHGLIEALDDRGDEHKIVTASAPLAKMLGYNELVALTTRNSAVVEYEFLEYRPVLTLPIPPASRG